MRRLSASVALIVLAAAGAAERVEVGMAERIVGAAEARYGGSARRLGVPDPVYHAELLSTGAASRLLVRLADSSEVTLGEHAELLVDEFIYDPGADRRVVALRSLAGAFLLAVDDAVGPAQSEISVTTPAAVIGIRGTTVWGGEIDAGYGILALAGRVTVTTPAGTAVLEPGEGVTITLAQELPPVLAWPEEKVARAVATVAFPE